MNNLIQAEFFKIFRRKSLYICSLILLLSAILAVGTTVYFSQKALEGSFQVSSEQLNTFKNLSAVSFVRTSASNDESIVIIIAVFIALLISVEYNDGTIKNIVSKGFARTKIYLSKLIAAGISAIMLYMVYFVSLFLAAAFAWGIGTITLGIFVDTSIILLIEWLLYFATAAVIVWLSTMIKNVGGCVAVSISIVLLGSLVIQLVSAFTQGNLDLGKYWLVSIMREVSHGGVVQSVITRGSVVALIYFLIAAAAGSCIFKIQDIK